ncbi:zinc-binding alcohol dehydrogenase family protein [Hyphomicrobium sp.]|uniref:quinone oxidoreductase family protein n=1 Tax=Hyphomicrobium sp. TaxID=82 RepID=UPI0025C24DC2|nr:zinc-binding alcohol dehydrogenase family protein [Hyphomicrobium sp.]MCC7250727.1 zinc-binding alcohol dehydrogenase family protein [Hyphomicrobium sp.]
MNALSIHAFGEPPRLGDRPAPETREGEVLVRLEATVLSRHDLDVARGRLPHHPPLPYVPGLEGAGRVIAAGPGVDCGRIREGALVRVYGGGLGANRPGTWSELVACPARAVTPVPDGIEAVVAAACGSVALTAASALDLGRLAPGERLGVTGGSGAVGSLVLQLAHGRGVRGCVAWLRSREYASALPPGTQLVLPGGDPPTERVDLLVDTVGGSQLPARLRSVRSGGRAVLIGYTAGSTVTFDLRNLLDGDVEVLPLNMRRRRLPDGLEAQLLNEFACGRLAVATEVVGLDDVAEALNRLDAGEVAGRLVLRW